MTDVRAAAESFLEEKPGLEDRLEDLLAVDEDHETWTFQDVPFDSGTFGELVSRDIVEKADGEYRLRDPDAVRQALGKDIVVGEDTSEGASSSFLGVSLSLPDLKVDRIAALGLGCALALVVFFRILPFFSVFKDGNIVLSGNDPYYYRYLVHQVLAESSGPLDLSALSALPEVITHGEPLLVATLWWVSSLVGGAADFVLAIYPVFLAVASALLLYVMTVRVTKDKRVGIAAVALLAMIPAHAFRTGLGFADHHAFDYFWLALIALAVVELVDRDVQDRWTWVWALILAVGVGGQTLAWDAGPLLLIPLALFAVTVVPAWLRDGRSPFAEGLPLVGGLAIGSAIVGGAHLLFGWHSLVVVASPALLLGGVLGVIALGTAANRFEASVRSFVGIEFAVAIAGVLVFQVVFPDFTAELIRGIDFLFSTGGIAETMSLVSGQLGSIVAPILVFGFALLLALPYLGWATWLSYRQYAPAWLAMSCYGWYFLVLALVQIRFAGQLALFTALFGGLGFVHLAAWVDLTEQPRPFSSTEASPVLMSSLAGRSSSNEEDLQSPERRQALQTAGLGLGVGSLGMLMIPIKHSQLAIDDSMLETARFMRAYSEEKGWDYAENYVFSRWSRNRVYNWFVNGESRSYVYAKSNFEDFITSTDGDEWYKRLLDRVGFVVVDDEFSVDAGGETLYERLYADDFGFETDHYRAVWTADDDKRRVYTLVPGARVTGPGPKNGTVTITGDSAIEGRDLTVSTEFSAGTNGVYDKWIPLPGQYTIGNRAIEISEDDVIGGASLSTFDAEGYAYWPFDEGSGGVAYDHAGTNHAQIHGAEWIDEGRDGPALSFDGEGSYVETTFESLQEFTISLWVYPTTLDVSGENDYRDLVATGGGSSILVLEQSGNFSFRLPGTGTSRLVGSRAETGNWTHVAVTFDGKTRMMYIDGQLKATDRVVTGETLNWGNRLRIGNRSTSSSLHSYAGRIDEFRIYDKALAESKLEVVIEST